MPSALLPLLSFLAVLLSVAAVFSLLSDLLLRDHKRIKDRLGVEFHNKQRARIKRSLLLKNNNPYQEIIEGAETPRLNWRERLQVALDQSGLELTQIRFFIFCGVAAVTAGLLAGLFARNPWIGLAAAAIGACCPRGYVEIKRKARLEAMSKQLSDAFDMMARILRSGQSMAQAMQGVANEFPSPISEEFMYCSEQQNLGLSPEISLRELAKRTGLVEMNIFVVAVLVQRQVGGNLSDILEKLAFIVRQRFKTRGTIKTLTAEGRMQAAVLMAMPPLLLVAMLIANHDYAMVLIHQPKLLGGMVFFMVLGGLWINKIVNFDF
jgi:tight adherence protein B